MTMICGDLTGGCVRGFIVVLGVCVFIKACELNGHYYEQPVFGFRLYIDVHYSVRYYTLFDCIYNNNNINGL